MPDQLLPYLAVVGLLTLVPGPDMALVLRNGIRGGSSVAWWTGLGCCTGISVYAAASAIGVAAVLAASATAFTIIKIAGAAYLIYLGVMALWHARHHHGALAAAERTTGEVTRRIAYRQGLMSNLLNPKIALIFLTLIPQFVSRDEPAFATTAFLAATFLAMAVLWWRVFSLGVGALGRLLARDRVRAAIEALTGVVMIGLGLRVAVTDH